MARASASARASNSWGKKEPLIVDAALRVFARRGFHEATMQDVADEAGVGKGTLYYYARSKEDLFFLAAKRWADAIDGVVESAEKSKLAPAEQIRLIVQEHLRLLLSSKPLIQVMFSESPGTHQVFLESTREARDRFVRLVSGILERGRKQGAIRADLEPLECARALIGFTIFYSIKTDWEPEGEGDQLAVLERAARSLSEIFLNGVLARPGEAF